MTTIISDLRNGDVYTDSRGTYVSTYGFFKKKEKIHSHVKSMKVFKLKGLLCAKVGNEIGSDAVINQIKKGTYQDLLGSSYKVLKDHAGGIVITRKGYCILLKVDDNGKFTRKVYYGTETIKTFGSGLSAAVLRNIGRNLKSLSLLDRDILIKIMKYNSLFDKYSDDEIVYSNQTLEHWVYK